mgnify:CR=1 FL=1
MCVHAVPVCASVRASSAEFRPLPPFPVVTVVLLPSFFLAFGEDRFAREAPHSVRVAVGRPAGDLLK